MYPTDYYTMIRSKNHIFDYRLHMVHSAITLGVKPTARIYKTSAPSVRKWRDRFEDEGSAGLRDRSRAPHSCPHKLPKEAEDTITTLRKRLPGFGAEHLKDEFDLPWGVNSIARVIRQNCKTRIKKKKHQKKNDLRHIKAAYKPFTHFQIDVKYLTDLPHYWPFMQFMGLPRFQYTIRELSTGAQFLTYADEISKTYAILTAKRLLEHLKKYGVDLTEVVIQSDNGSEFDGGHLNEEAKGFIHAIEKCFKARHVYIPPGCCNANADVESVHSTIEPEFFDIENFRNRKDFFSKITTYQHYYNLARKNGSRGKKSPLTLLTEKAPKLNPRILILPPLDLCSLLPLLDQGVNHVPSEPERLLTEAHLPRGGWDRHRSTSHPPSPVSISVRPDRPPWRRCRSRDRRKQSVPGSGKKETLLEPGGGRVRSGPPRPPGQRYEHRSLPPPP